MKKWILLTKHKTNDGLCKDEKKEKAKGNIWIIRKAEELKRNWQTHQITAFPLTEEKKKEKTTSNPTIKRDKLLRKQNANPKDINFIADFQYLETEKLKEDKNENQNRKYKKKEYKLMPRWEEPEENALAPAALTFQRRLHP